MKESVVYTVGQLFSNYRVVSPQGLLGNKPSELLSVLDFLCEKSFKTSVIGNEVVKGFCFSFVCLFLCLFLRVVRRDLYFKK